MSSRRWRPSTTHPRRPKVSTQLLEHVSPDALWSSVLELWNRVCGDETLPPATREHLSRSLHRALMGIAESGTRSDGLEEAQRAITEAETVLAAVRANQSPHQQRFAPDSAVFFGD